MIDDGVVREEVLVDATPELVFEFFVDPTKLPLWLGIAADIDARPGGRFRFEVVPGEFCEGRYLEVEPPRRVSFTWGWTSEAMGVPPGSSHVNVELVPEGGGTRVRLTHTGLPTDDSLLLHADGWSRFFERLGAVATGAEPAAYPDEDPGERLRDLKG